MRKPVIGVLPQFDTGEDQIFVQANYFRALKEAGAIPFLFPLQSDLADAKELLDRIDGILYTGGPDVSPLLFGEETIPACGKAVPDRDTLELGLLPFVLERDIPVLGICRGIQSLNIGLGGTIYQDIPSQYIVPEGKPSVGHSQKSQGKVETHSIAVEKNTLLYDIVKKDRILVNSFHHQAVKNPALPWQCAGTAADGLVECMYRPESKFFLGVQWHPEYLYPHNEDARKIFEVFAAACR